jgi:hypothetical protein
MEVCVGHRALRSADLSCCSEKRGTYAPLVQPEQAKKPPQIAQGVPATAALSQGQLLFDA